MKQLSDEEINDIWDNGMTFKELVQAAYELGYKLGYNSAYNKMFEKIIKKTGTDNG